VKFEIAHRFQTTIADFERVLDDPGLYDKLRLPGIEKIEPLERVDEGGRIRRRVRYTPNTDGKIPSFGRSVVKPSMLRWIEESTYDKGRHRFDYRILPNLPDKWRDFFQSQGSYQLTQEGAEVHRVIEGEIVVRVPLLGRTVEKLLVKEVTANFRAEAEAMSALLRAV
jgi:Protein of unknown function (DUF2505)